jgi:hypothetical protein
MREISETSRGNLINKLRQALQTQSFLLQRKPISANGGKSDRAIATS